MAEHTDPSPVLPSGESTTPTHATPLPSLPVALGVQPGDHAATNDAQKAIQQLDRLTEIESGLAEAAREVIADTVGEDQQQHMQHAQELEEKMENQVDALNLPKEEPTTALHGLEQPVAAQDVGDGGRGYASSEDAEGEIDLDLGGMDDDEYDQDTYGQGTTHDVTVTPNRDVDAYNESTTKDEAMPLSTSEEGVSAEVPVVASNPTDHQSTPKVHDVPAEVTPTVEEAKPVSIRRRPGHQRQSPSYNMDTVASSNVTARPAPPSFLPARPVMAAEPQAPIRQPFNHIDLSTVTFPEGLSADSPSVQRHPAWVKAWKGGESHLNPHPIVH